MSDEQETSEDLVAEALKSVQRLQQERDGAAPAAGDDEDLDVESIEVLKPGDTPPSADPNAVSDAQPLEPEAQEEAAPAEEEELLVEEEPDAETPSEKPAAKPSAQDAILQSMIEAKNEAVEALAQTQHEAKSMKERLTRVSADFENYKKRQARERAEAVRFANESVLKELLPVLDNMERAVDAAKKSGDEPAALETMIEGVEMVYRQFQETLSKFGIQSFTALGARFDPARHEAVGGREDTSVPSQTVLEEYQRGYMIHDRLARPAMVVVSSGGPQNKPAQAGSEGVEPAKEDAEPEPNEGN